MSVNTSKINQFKFQILGEVVQIWYHMGPLDNLDTGSGNTNNGGAVGTWNLLCSQGQATPTQWETSAKNGRNNYPSPYGQQNWLSYPKVYIQRDGASVYLDITKWGGRKGMVYGSPLTDWTARMSSNGTPQEVASLEARRIFSDGDSLPLEPFTPQLAIGAKNIDKYVYTFVLAPDSIYKPTDQANMNNMLGFNPSTLTPTTLAPSNPSANIYLYLSNQVPDLSGDISMFVRLGNFTQRSFNAGVGRPSKILYMLPRFDTSGNDSGNGLFYEPGQRVYIRLGNSEPLYINEFDLSICSDREIITRSLTGQTIINLHFRQSEDSSRATQFKLGGPQ